MGSPVTIEGLDLINGVAQVQQAHAKYSAAVDRGRVFSQTTTPLGLAIPIYTATAPLGNVLWNPPGSGVKIVLMTYSAVRASGTADFGVIGLMAQKGFGADVATGSAITAFAETTPVNGLFGAGEGTKIKSSNAGTVTITAFAAEDFIHTIAGMNLEADTGTAHETLPAVYDFEGQVKLLPGTFAFVAATKASSALYGQTITWEEELL